MDQKLNELYHAWLGVDRDFHTALVAEYGGKEAGNARYKYTHNNPEVQTFRDQYQKASHAYLDHLKALRSAERSGAANG